MQPEDVSQILHDPLAQELLHAGIPARLAYTGTDGFPRVIPIAFQWNGARIIVCTLPYAAKVRALTIHPKVALTVDATTWPPNLLLVRGTAGVEMVDGVPPEYFEGSKKLVDADQWETFEAGVRGLYTQMVRITIVPEWAKLMDFETRLPSAVAQLIAQQRS